MTASEQTPARRRGWLIGGIAAVVLAAGAALTWALWPEGEPVAAPAPTVTVTPTPVSTPTPTPTPTPTGPAENTTEYDLQALPEVNVFAVIDALPVDDDPYGAFTGDAVTAVGASAPVFADPTGEPVAALPRDYAYDGTTVPVIEQHEHWARVLLTGRSARPSEGDPAQVTGWVRMADVATSTVDAVVEVSLADRTIDIVRAGDATRIATDFAWGTEATPTPEGRAFIMLSRAVPSFAYTRGHPIVYLSVQSPTLDGFDGADAAVTAFHYHDARSGAISNGCIRVDPDAITALAELPLGTPVVVRG